MEHASAVPPPPPTAPPPLAADDANGDGGGWCEHLTTLSVSDDSCSETPCSLGGVALGSYLGAPVAGVEGSMAEEEHGAATVDDAPCEAASGRVSLGAARRVEAVNGAGTSGGGARAAWMHEERKGPQDGDDAAGVKARELMALVQLARQSVGSESSLEFLAMARSFAARW